MTGAPVHGVVLAAGRSTRMGMPKPLLRIGGATFLERALRCLREGGCGSVSAVINAADAAVRAHATATGAMIVENPDPGSEQIDSLRLALARVPVDAAAAVVLPVDVPRVQVATIAAVVQAFRGRDAPLVAPTYEGVAGHPVLLARAAFEIVRSSTLPHGLRSLLEERADLMVDVPVDDPGICIDVDTPEEYAALMDR